MFPSQTIKGGIGKVLLPPLIVLIIRIGTRIFDQASGWWGGVFFALLPLNVYYGRTFQAESLLLFLAAVIK